MTLLAQSLPYVRAISPYQPGKPITQLARDLGLAVEQIVKLASNENPLGMSPKAQAAVAEAVSGLSRYPDDFALKQALAERSGLGMERIVLGNGSNDVLDLIARLKQDTSKIILLVEHKMDVVRSLADRIIVLTNGACVADGEPAAVIASPVVQEAYLGIAPKEKGNAA